MSTGLYEKELDCLAGRILKKFTNTRWKGVYARDELPNLDTLIQPYALIVNSQPRGQPGEHWLAIYGPRTDKTELFDSFGYPPSFYNLDQNLVDHSYQFQSPTSVTCGHYCIWFIYARSLGDPYAEIVDSLANRKSGRDSYVISQVNRLKRVFNVVNPCLRTGQCCTPKCSFC